MSNILRVNETFMKQIACTNAHFVYDAVYGGNTVFGKNDKMVKKARDIKMYPNLVANMEARGFRVPTAGDPNPFKRIRKHQEYGITFGSSLNYVRMQEKKLAKGGIEGSYEPGRTDRKDGKPTYVTPYCFPIYKELIYLGFDMETIYFAAYPMADEKIKPEAYWEVDGVPCCSKYLFAPWANSKEFNLWAKNVINRTPVRDENGNVVEKEDNSVAYVREYIKVKMDNCQILINDEDIRPKMFEKVSFYSDDELIEMSNKYMENYKAEYNRKLKEWEARQASK